MNILIPHKWLLEHLETDASVKKIQECLSLCGPSVERIYDRNGDVVYDIEITTNRVDAMSIRGIAREAAVILPQFGFKAKLKKKEKKALRTIKSTDKLPLPKVVNNPKLCKRTICIILKDVKRTPTPEWMAKRLSMIEMNIHESAIDITNYITHELGHPCHAFDYDKLMATGGKIIIKQATAGKKFTTLDGENYTTVGGEIVFENNKEEIIDLPAIKGTANTSIDDKTNNILLWLETLDAKKVRHASMTHAIRTVAAQLEEKKVDPTLAKDVLLRGVELYQDLCQAKIASEIYDDFPGEKELKTVKISNSRIEEYLGIKLKDEQIKQIMTNLGCQVQISKDGEISTYSITPPSYRPDLTIAADIIEELARIYGYHNLPSILMPSRIPTTYPKDTNFILENMVKHYLVNIGYQEMYTYSMVSAKIAKESDYNLDNHLKIANPLTEDNIYMRRSLIPSLIEAVNANPNRNNLSVFEMANIYHKKDEKELPNEILSLGLISTKPYEQVKGDLDSLLDKLHISNITIEQNNNDQAYIVVNNDKLGKIKIKQNKTTIELIWSQILKHAKNHPTYHPIPKTNSIIEDLTFTIKGKTQIGSIIKNIKQVNEYIKNVKLKDTYQNNYSFTIEYLNPESNIAKEDVEPIRKKIVKLINKHHNGELVGEV